MRGGGVCVPKGYVNTRCGGGATLSDALLDSAVRTHRDASLQEASLQGCACLTMRVPTWCVGTGVFRRGVAGACCYGVGV